jgi:hypothetical protein
MKNVFLILMFLGFNFVLKAQKSICQGDCENGFGILVSSNGDQFEGNWKNGIKNGKFKYFYKSGSKFEGYVVDDIIEGQGTYETPLYSLVGNLTQISLGNYTSRIVLNGKGTKRYKNGDVYEGFFVNGDREGLGKYTYSSGAIRKGNWIKDKFVETGSNFSKSTNVINLILRENGQGYDLPVKFDRQLVINMHLDTGADMMLLKKEIIDSLLESGKIQNIENGENSKFLDAGGHINPVKVYLIKSLMVGNYILKDVECSVNNNINNSPNLFGINALRKLGKQIKIDLLDNILIVD